MLKSSCFHTQTSGFSTAVKSVKTTNYFSVSGVIGTLAKLMVECHLLLRPPGSFEDIDVEACIWTY